ncbi:MAG: AAA family ATPase [Candidatus Omnitrophota bacterium]
MRIITFVNQKGGCGKTITAVNLAGAFSGAGKRVLFIDIDPQAHATSAFGLNIQDPSKSSYAIFDAFLGRADKDLRPLMQHRYKNLWVVGSHLSLSTMEQKMANRESAILAFSRVMSANDLSGFDYIFIDTPPSLGFLTLNAIVAADSMVVPLDVSLFSLNGVTQIKKVLDISSRMGLRKAEVNYLITMFDGRSNFAKNFFKRAQATFGDGLFTTVVRSNVKLREAALEGKVIFEYAPYANGAKDYMSLASELAPDIKDAKLDFRPEEDTASVTSEGPETSFSLHAPEAGSVYITGTFNNWQVANEYMMEKSADGLWVKKLRLDPGRHLYKFVIDGVWKEDPGCESMEDDMVGGRNSVKLIA